MKYQYSSIIEHLEKLPAEKQSYILDALPRHLIAGRQADRATELLTDYGFLTAKCSRVAVSALPDGELKYRGVYELLTDYEELLSGLGHDNERVRNLAESYELSFRDAAHILVRWPDLTFQEIYSRIKLMQGSEKVGRADWRKTLLDYRLQVVQFLHANAVRFRRFIFDKPTHRVLALPAPSLSTELSSVYQSENVWLEGLNTPLPQSSFIKCFGHVGQINSMEFFHDGRLISFGEDGTARIWDTTNGKEIREIRFCSHALADGKIAADQTWGIALCPQCGVFRFRVSSGESRNIKILFDSPLQQNETSFRTCHFLPHTPSNVVISKGDTLWIVDLEEPTSPVPLRADLQDFSRKWDAPHLPDDFADRMLNESFGEIACTALDPDSMSLLASYSVGGAIEWDLMSQKVANYIPLAWQVLNIVFQPKKSETGWLMGSFNPKEQHLMCVETFRISGGSYGVFAAEQLLQFPWCASRTGDYVASTEGRDSQLVVRQLGDSRSNGEIILELENHNGNVTCAAFTADSRHVASAGEDSVIQVWPLVKTTRQADDMPPDNVFDCYVLDSPGRVAQLVQRRNHTGELLMRYYTLPEFKYEYEQPLLYPEAFGNETSGQRKGPMTLLSRNGNTTACVAPGEYGLLWEMAFSAWRWLMKQSHLPIRALTPMLQIWDTQTGGKLFEDTFVGIAPGDWPVEAAISRNGQVVVTLSGRGLVTIVDINEKEPVYLGAFERLHRIAVNHSEDAVMILALSADTLLKFDHMNMEFEALWCSMSKTKLTAFCCLPGSRRVLIGDNNGRFVLLDISNDEHPQTLASWQAHKGSVRSCTVDVTGRICVSAGDDLLIRMWHLEDQNEISRAPIEAPIASLAFQEKDGIIVATDQTRRFYAWQLKEFSITGNERP